MNRKVFSLFILSVVLFACSKKPSDSSSDSHKNVYALGYGTNMTSALPYPVYWSEGKEIVLGDDKAYAKAIFLKDSDVYITGSIDDQPVYWVNGVANYLTHSISSGLSASLSFDHDDLYILGNVDGEILIWKNGIIFKRLPKFQPYSAIITHKSDVHYVIQKNKSGNTVTEYWKNESMTEIPSYNKVIKHIAVLNDDVYLAGNNPSETEISIWKNTVHTAIDSTPDATKKRLRIESISIDGADVYLFYYEVDIINKSFIVKYWKNGNLYTLKTADNLIDIGYIKAMGGNIYYLGIYNDTLPGGAFYFVNETIHYLKKDYYSGVRDITIKQ